MPVPEGGGFVVVVAAPEAPVTDELLVVGADAMVPVVPVAADVIAAAVVDAACLAMRAAPSSTWFIIGILSSGSPRWTGAVDCRQIKGR